MPRLADVVQVLEDYRERYTYLDAFVDDIDDLTQPFGSSVRALPPEPGPHAELWVEGRRLSLELFADRGVARFRLLEGGRPPLPSDAVGQAAALGAAVGAAIGAASRTKEGLLGGLVLGILVGGLLGAAVVPVDRALALRFDPGTSSWKLYDGPLLQWAKQTMVPAT